MLQKPELTIEQKKKFTDEFNAIMAKSPKEVKNLWVDGAITWVMDIPHFHNSIHLKLTGDLKDEYISLDRKLKNRTI